MENNINYDEVKFLYHSVKELYLEYYAEWNKEKKTLEFLTNDINDIEDYIRYLQEHQNSDTFVFSPRGVISKNSGKNQEGIFDTGKLIDFNDVVKKKEELNIFLQQKTDLEEKIRKLEETISLFEKTKKILKEVSVLKENYDKEKIACDEKQKLAIKEYTEKREEILKCLKDGPIEKLSYVLHMTDMISNFIDNDPVRAKLELMKIKDNLQDISKDLEEITKVPEGDN